MEKLLLLIERRNKLLKEYIKSYDERTKDYDMPFPEQIETLEKEIITIIYTLKEIDFLLIYKENPWLNKYKNEIHKGII